MLRRTMPELERSLIPAALRLYPQRIASYKVSEHRWDFINGSTLEFGYCDAESDVTRYQSAEYDVLRFDELTHFTESQFTYLISRVRGANGFPKQVKSTTNPGGVGHQWVKKRYIDPAPPDTLTEFAGGTRLFLPARLADNPYLCQADAGYEKRLQLLSVRDRKALLEGVWELNEGQYFSEFSEALHVVSPHPIPSGWKRYLTIDYGLDMLAALWIAQGPNGDSVVYRELYQPNLIISQAAAAILAQESGKEQIYCRLAPPDLWNRRQETGKSAVELFADCGLLFDRSSNERVAGWLALHELLAPRQDETGAVRPRLTIFHTCRNLIRTLPALQHDSRNPSDVAGTPHELTHAPDALRGYAATVYQAPPAPPPSAYDADIGAFLRY
jgi:phage terminase large subunit